VELEGFGSSDPKNRSGESALPKKTVKFCNLKNPGEGGRGSHNLLGDYCAVLPSRSPICTWPNWYRGAFG
jgi:hypothetical protein